MILTLRILADAKQVEKVLLIGSHGNSADADEKSVDSIPKDVAAKIAADISASLSNINGAGYSQVLLALLKDALKSKVSIRTSLLMEYTTRRKLDNFRKIFQRQQSTISPIPIYPSKRDLVLLAAGIWPGYFRNKVFVEHAQDQGIAIYLDVSGSVNRYLPEIFGILQHLRRDIRSIYQFSNVVVETDFATLMQGHIKTSFGTDFDCVAASIQEKNYDKAIVITDGYASMKPEHQKTLSDRHVKILTILYGSSTTCDVLTPFGPVLKLSEVTI